MLHTHLLPALTTAEELADSTVVVIDVLRATTTITYALAAGAKEVVPCLEVEDVLKLKQQLPPGTYLLGGERGGLLIEGFDLGNSPIDYSRRRVADQTILFTTSNGTKAMMQCHQARQVLIGSFVNLSALAQVCLQAENVQLLCAGTNGRITREDVLFAGALAEKLILLGQIPPHALNDSTRLALDAWQNATHTPVPAEANAPDEAAQLSIRLAQALRQTQGGRNLRALGLEGDLDSVAIIDRYSIVPQLDLESWKIRPMTAA